MGSMFTRLQVAGAGQSRLDHDLHAGTAAQGSRSRPRARPRMGRADAGDGGDARDPAGAYRQRDRCRRIPKDYLAKDFATLMETMAAASGMKLESENKNVPTGPGIAGGRAHGIHALQRAAIDLQPAGALRAPRQGPAVRRASARPVRRRPAQAGLSEAQSERRGADARSRRRRRHRFLGHHGISRRGRPAGRACSPRTTAAPRHTCAR